MPAVLVINPRTDDDFVGLVGALGVDAQSPTELQELLRSRYPLVVVRRRELAGERTQVWYVYRDGHWSSTDEGGRRRTDERSDG